MYRLGKQKKNVEYFRQYSTDCHQIFTKTVSGHLILVTDDIEYVGQYTKTLIIEE